MNSHAIFKALLLVTILISSTFAQTKRNEKTRLDNYGDPLPKGAIARLGTARLREDNMVRSVAFSPDGKLLVTSSYWDIKLWETSTGKLVHRFMAGSINCASLSKDGQFILTFCDAHPVYATRVLRLWDVKNKKIIQEIKTKNLSLNDDDDYFIKFDFHPDGKRYVAYSRHGAIHFIDRKTLGETDFKKSDQKTIYRSVFALSPDGKHMVVGKEEDGAIQILDVPEHGQPLKPQNVKKYYGTKGEVVLLKFLNTNTLAVSILDQDIKRLQSGREVTTIHNVAIDLWDISKMKRVGTLNPPEKVNKIGSITPSLDGKFLYAFHGKSIEIWDVRNRKIIDRFPVLQLTKSYYAFPHGIAVSNDGKLLALASHPRMVQLWDLPQKKTKLPKAIGHTGEILSITWTSDGKYLVSASGDGSIRFWDIKKSKEVKKFVHWEKGGRIFHCSVSKDGSTLAAVGITNGNAIGVPWELLKVWNIETGKTLCDIRLSGKSAKVALSFDGSFVASDLSSSKSGGSSNTVQVFRTKTSKKVATLDFPSSYVGGISFSKKGNRLWASTGRRGLFQWDIETQKEIQRLHPKESMGQTAFSTHADLAVFVKNSHLVLKVLPNGVEKKYRIHNTALRDFAMRYNYISMTKFGHIIATKRTTPSTFENAVDALDTLSGKTVFSTGPVELVTDIALSPDGSKLATAIYDGTILVWKVYDNSNTKITKPVLQKSWERLTTSSMPTVWQAINRMTSTPAKTVVFLSKRLIPTEKDLPSDTKKLIAALESKSFAKRRQAYSKLKSYGSAISYILQLSAKTTLSPEVKKRLLQLIQSSETQNLRSIQILERIGAEKAKSLIEKLANGDPKTNQTTEAKRILKRWKTKK